MPRLGCRLETGDCRKSAWLLFVSDLQPQASSLQSDSVADGLFTKSRIFYVLPEGGMKALEELFRNRVIAMLLKKELLPPERARMLLSWVHTGFNVHHSRRIWPREQKDLEAIAQIRLETGDCRL